MNTFTLRTNANTEFEQKIAYKLLAIINAIDIKKRVEDKFTVFTFETNVDYQAIHISELFQNVLRTFLSIDSKEIAVIYKSIKQDDKMYASDQEIEDFDITYTFQTELKSDDVKIQPLLNKLNLEITELIQTEKEDCSVWTIKIKDEFQTSTQIRRKFNKVISFHEEFIDLNCVVKTLTKGLEPLNNYIYS